MASNTTTNHTDFNPYTQTMTLLASDQTPIPVTIPDIDDYVTYAVRICINYSSQIGASIILLACLLLMTRPDKRTTTVFILNALALFFNAVRSICQCIYFTGQFYEFYAYFSQDYAAVPPSQYAASITGIVFTLLLVITLEASLVLQVHVIVATPAVPPLHRHLLTSVSLLVALLAIAFRFALAVRNALAVRAAADFSNYQWLVETSTYVTTASICFFSAVFLAKLAVALHRRRTTLGLVRFGPMEILCTMACQTLVVPAVFAVLQNFTSVPELGSQMLTVTAIFLPMSSLWAAASVEQSLTARAGPGVGGRLVGGGAGTGGAGGGMGGAGGGKWRRGNTDGGKWRWGNADRAHRREGIFGTLMSRTTKSPRVVQGKDVEQGIDAETETTTTTTTASSTPKM